jgi:hypothetical protein
VTGSRSRCRNTSSSASMPPRTRRDAADGDRVRWR